MFIPMIGLVQSFLITGSWVIEKKETMKFIMEPSKIISLNHEIGSRISMRPRVMEWKNETFFMELYDLHVEQRPRDWFNLRKYSRYIVYMDRIKRHGIHVKIIFHHKDRIEVSAMIDKDPIPSFILIRQISPHKDEF